MLCVFLLWCKCVVCVSGVCVCGLGVVCCDVRVRGLCGMVCLCGALCVYVSVVCVGCVTVVCVVGVCVCMGVVGVCVVGVCISV